MIAVGVTYRVCYWGTRHKFEWWTELDQDVQRTTANDDDDDDDAGWKKTTKSQKVSAFRAVRFMYITWTTATVATRSPSTPLASARFEYTTYFSCYLYVTNDPG